jgi:diguanylate cyclase (GGDEF)-like protein
VNTPASVTEPPDDAGKLASLGVKVEAMQAVLVRLLQDVVRAEARLLRDGSAATLQAVNEQLVVAALLSRSEAETAAETAALAVQAAARSNLQDALTGLPNRTALIDRFTQAIGNARRHGKRVALLFVDLNDFKRVNDNHGHAFGDHVLSLAATRMQSVVREVDTVSRHGGDEFLILLSEIAHRADAEQVAEKLAAALAAPGEIEGQPVSLSASIGIAVFPDDGEQVDALVARADAAMYERKRLHHPASAAPAVTPADAALVRQQLQRLRAANEQLVLSTLGAQELLAAADLARRRQAAFVDAVATELGDPQAPIRITSTMLGRTTAVAPLLPLVRGLVLQQQTNVERLLGQGVPAVSGSLHLVFDRVDLVPLVDAVLARHRPLFALHRQRLDVLRAPGALWVHGDAARLQQVLGNLLDNAAKHTPDGGRVTVELRADGDDLTLDVADDGIGITPEMLPHVFDPFVQDDHALGIHGVGLGIGLTVVRALVRAHGGNLVAHSAGAQRGSRFTVTLPLAAAA